MMLQNENVYGKVYLLGDSATYHLSNQFRIKHPHFCFPRFVSVWPSPEVVNGIFEVCPSATNWSHLVFHCDDRFLT